MFPILDFLLLAKNQGVLLLIFFLLALTDLVGCISSSPKLVRGQTEITSK